MNNLRTEYGNHTINSQKLEEFSHTLSAKLTCEVALHLARKKADGAGQRQPVPSHQSCATPIRHAFGVTGWRFG